MPNKPSRRKTILAILVGLVVVVAIGVVWQTSQPLFEHLFPIGQEAVTVYATVFPTTIVPTARQAPTSTPVLPATIQAPEIRTRLTLVWSKEAPRLYLRQAPNGLAVGVLENGTLITPGERVEAGGQTWIRVTGSGFEGWVAGSLIFTFGTEKPIMLVSGEDGAYLRTEPEGRITAILPRGTPVQIIETADMSGTTWARVILPDEGSGWIAQRLLTISGQ